MDLTGIYRTFHPHAKDCKFNSAAERIISKTQTQNKYSKIHKIEITIYPIWSHCDKLKIKRKQISTIVLNEYVKEWIKKK